MTTAPFNGDAIIPAMIGLLDAYSETAFADGYHQAIKDVLATHPLLALQFVQSRRRDGDDIYAVIHAFVQYLESHLNLEPPQAQTFIGGSGI